MSQEEYIQSDLSRVAKANVSTALIIIALVYSGSMVVTHYGWAMFLGIPFLFGFARASMSTIFKISERENYAMAMWPPILMVFAGCILFAIEGVVCLFMASPLILLTSYLGWVFGRMTSGILMGVFASIVAIALMTATVSIFHLFERSRAVEPPIWAVTTPIHIAASPEEVWNNVVTFSDLAPPKEWIFKAGVAYPTHATIICTGPGAVRRCEFNTGTFVEPITVWDEPRLLRFSVTENPIPMKELSIYADLSPAHLHGHFYSEQGEFRLEAQKDGSTILYGTTWYRQRLWPAHYWRFWSDGVIHKIHFRVLDHIKEISEEPPILARSSF